MAPHRNRGRVVAPRPTLLDRALDAPGQLRTAVALYRRTPARLRRPEPAIRLGVTIAAVWFTVLFAAMALAIARTGAGPTLPLGIPVTAGFTLAAGLGPVGLGLFLSRRPRPGLSVLGAMLALAQITAIAAAR